MGKKVMVFVGTEKGGFIFDSNAKRKKWQVSDIHFKSWNVMHMQLDPRDNRLHAATSHFVYGPTTHYSDDFGKTWTQAKQVPLINARLKVRAAGQHCRGGVPLRGRREREGYPGENDQGLEHQARQGE